MLDKIKAMPHKKSFAIGLTLLLVGSTISSILAVDTISMLLGGVLVFVGTLFIVAASDKRQSK
ncbi:MAG: hypothetical protein AB6733_23770 [Clostridiaceae bacterium]